MGKLNEINQETTQSYGSNSFTTTIKENTVEFDSAKDSFTFKDEINVPNLKINGTSTQVFTAEEKEKLSKVTTPMNIMGRVDTVSDLPSNANIGEVYLVGVAGGESFDEYVCIAVDGSDNAVWESLGSTSLSPVQSNWNQNDSTKSDYIKNRICYDNEPVNIVGETLTINEYGHIQGSNDSGVYYFNPTITFVTGATYTITIKDEVLNFTTSGNPDNSTGNGSVSTSQGYFSVLWDISGISGSPHNETAYITFYGSSEYAGSTLKFLTASDTKKIDEKYIPATIARKTDIPQITYTSTLTGLVKEIGTISVGSTNYSVNIPQVNYTNWSGDFVALESGKFEIHSGTQTAIHIAYAGKTNVINDLYAIFTAGDNFQMPDAGYCNVDSLVAGKRYFLHVIGDAIKGWYYFFTELTELS